MRDVLKALETSEAEHAEAAGGGARVLEAVSSSRKALSFSPGGQEMVWKSEGLDDWIEVFLPTNLVHVKKVWTTWKSHILYIYTVVHVHLIGFSLEKR